MNRHGIPPTIGLNRNLVVTKLPQALHEALHEIGSAKQPIIPMLQQSANPESRKARDPRKHKIKKRRKPKNFRLPLQPFTISFLCVPRKQKPGAPKNQDFDQGCCNCTASTVVITITISTMFDSDVCEKGLLRELNPGPLAP